MTLFGEEEDLSWIVFCNLPEGVVSGWVDVRTGAFTPSSAPPAVPPPVATPDAVTTTPESRSRWTSSFAASCVELYSTETLRHRAFAFDGIVESLETRVDPKLPAEGSQSQELPWVTLKVNQWFKGGESPEVAIWVDPHWLEGGWPLEPGDRLLVAGEYRWGQPPEDPFAWGCGFTQPYTPEAAAQWADAMTEPTATPSIQTSTPAPTPVEPVAREALQRIAQAGLGEVAPGFGGLFLDSSDNSIVYVYMLDPSQQEAAEEAAKIILGRERFEQEIREVQVLQGQYSWDQLLVWYREAQKAVWIVDRVYSSDIDERRNRIVFGVVNEYTEGQVREALAKTSVPQEAVVFDVAPKHKLDDLPVQLDSLIGVLISLEFERAVSKGQPVSIEVVLTNESDDTVEFDHGIPFHENVMIFTSDGDQVWAKIRGEVLVGTEGTTQLRPGEQVRLPTIWDQRDQDGFALPAGRYLVRGAAHIGDVFDGFYRPMDFATEPYELVIQP